MQVKNSRYWAYKGLWEVYFNGGYSNIVIDKILNESRMESNDRALCTSIFYGVIERKLSLRYIISKFSKIKLNNISDEVLILLQMGIYQIVYMDKIPDFSAVNEIVNLTKALKLHSSIGFVNAILRNVARNKNIDLPTKESSKNLSIRYSCNEELIDLWLRSYGKDVTIKILESALNVGSISARVNTLKTSTDKLLFSLKEKGIQASKGLLKDSIDLKKVGSLDRLEQFRNGDFHIENLSSQICCEVLNPKAGERILDACSAPGGKSFTIAEIMKDNGKILSFDLYESKINLVKSGAKRLGISIIEAKVCDSSAFSFKEIEKFDKVLCDVPCSGLGVVRKKPEIKYKKYEEIKNITEIQYKILSNVKDAVKLGGTLIYSTCTINREENNDIADKFLKENEEFEPVEVKVNGIERVIDEKKNQLTIMPFGDYNTDGFFVAAFKRVKVGKE